MKKTLIVLIILLSTPQTLLSQESKDDKNNIWAMVSPVYSELRDKYTELYEIRQDLRNSIITSSYKNTLQACALVAVIEKSFQTMIVYTYVMGNMDRWELITQKSNISLNCLFESEDIERISKKISNEILESIQIASIQIKNMAVLHLIDKLKGNIRSLITLLDTYDKILKSQMPD